MKILFFSDLHGDMEALKQLKKQSKDADIVVCAGDISVMEKNLPKILSELDAFKKPTLIIPGNHENEERLQNLCENHDNLIYLHKAVHKVEEYIFMGYGGDGFSTTDPTFIKVAFSFFKKEAKNIKRLILITHGPPYDTKIDDLDGVPRGNKSYREFIDDIKPHLAISGHLHENAGKHHKIGRTLFINAGKQGAFVNI
jgi:uncharacterized protein